MFLKTRNSNVHAVTITVTICCLMAKAISIEYMAQDYDESAGGGFGADSSSELIFDSTQLQQPEPHQELPDYQMDVDNRTLFRPLDGYYPSAENTTESLEEVDTEEDMMDNKIAKELPALPPTTMLPEYIIQNHRINRMDIGSSMAEMEAAEPEIATIEATNETFAYAMKAPIIYTDDDNTLQAHNLDQETNQYMLDTYNRSAEEEQYEEEQRTGPSGTTTYAPMAVAVIATSTTALPMAPAPTVGRTKKGKQIRVKKLLPHEQLRNYIEDAYIRMPLAVIVDPSPVSLERTKALWRDALRTNFAIKIVLIALNGPGIPTAYNFNNTRQFLAGLNSIKENTGGNAFVGVIHASDLVPYDSAVFISTAAIPRHTDLVQDAAITLLKKRIRLYLIWYGEKSINENETQDATGGILGEVAIRSGGEILHVMGSQESQEIEGNTLTLVADAFHGTESIEIPVDTTLSSLHIKIDSAMKSATLETPNGEINLKKLVKFKSILVDNSDTRLDAYVPLYKVMKSTMFNLNLVPENANRDYNVYVRAERRPDKFLGDMLQKLDQNYLNRDGRKYSLTHENLRFPDDLSEDAEIIPTTEPTNQTKASQQQPNLVQTTTQIELGIQSQLLLAPGMMGKIYFELTNLRPEPVFHNIMVVGEKKFLRSLIPERVYLPTRQTVTVTVTVVIPENTPQGTRDRITLTCQGNEQSSRTVEVKVITSLDAQDTTPPAVSWHFGSRCDSTNSNSASCTDRFWNLEVTAQDWETGLLRLQSTPEGLITSNSFIVGSNEPARATYFANCCQPKVTLTAYDLAGNQRSHTIDVRDVILSEASIAAIVLGAILLILLIVLFIILIVWCVRRKKEASHDLPTYRTQRSERATRT